MSKYHLGKKISKDGEDMMNPNKENVLSGAHNKRLNNIDSTNSELTAARTNIEDIFGEGKVGVPSEECVLEAKDWVDNGSQL